MLNVKKNLRTGETVWSLYPKPRIHAEKLASAKLSADIVIIGSGITGAMVAEELAASGFGVVIIDRRGPLKGSTSATTALLQYEIDEPIINLQKKIGLEKAGRAWRRSKLGLESLSAKIQGLNIECEMERRSSLYLAGNELNAGELKTEHELRNSIGLHNEYLTRNDLKDGFDIKRSAAIKSFDNLSANPIKLAAGFLVTAQNKGAKIYAPYTVNEVQPVKSGVELTLESGETIKAKHVIFATGYEITKYTRSKKHTISSTWAIATKPQKNKLWNEECFIWEASIPYLYMRTTPDGRVICGGEDEEFFTEEKRDNAIDKKTAKIEQKLKELFPQLDTRAEFAWTGSFGGSTTGLPSIGAVPGMKNCYAIMAFGGNGITYSRIAAEMIKGELLGKKDPDADLFRFS